ncbi:DEAD/DEAH box helicase family protein [Streptacidiphilus sp. EB103A]|uniref:DEAD/DEAH box helicase n=1 Tax=Streptacidiphilus sp. EB103A TaxID=3156275 RepID=UPI0035179410
MTNTKPSVKEHLLTSSCRPSVPVGGYDSGDHQPPRSQPRPHQLEALDSAESHLTLPASGVLPSEGLRCQIRSATGTGKSLTAVWLADRLNADRVLVLAPTLALLEQNVGVWQREGRGGLMLGLCSLKAGHRPQGMDCTTDPDALLEWTRGADRVTVFATYSSLKNLEAAHQRGLIPWDLTVVDEAHRTSGACDKSWAVIHDNQRIPSDRRCYMTATPRMWEPREEDAVAAYERGMGPDDLVASMDSPLFGPVAADFSLGEAIAAGMIAPYRILCVDIRDDHLNHLLAVGHDRNSPQVRGARLEALRTAALTATAAYDLRRTLTFHHRVAEARSFNAGLGEVARELWLRHPTQSPNPNRLWTRTLHSADSMTVRRRALSEFEAGADIYGTAMERSLLSSVKLLGEGVDTRECDSVIFCDMPGSMPDLIQAVGRCLRMQPGEGKISTIIVPIFLGPGELPGDMLTSKAYKDLVRLLEALRAHDREAVEQLALPRSGAETWRPEILQFSTWRDPVLLATCMKLRVLRPELVEFTRGVAASTLYRDQVGDLRVPYNCRIEVPGIGLYSLGAWIAAVRRDRSAGALDNDQIAILDALDMEWAPSAGRIGGGGPGRHHGLLAGVQFRTREGHMNVPLAHMEPIVLDDGSTVLVKLGRFLASC